MADEIGTMNVYLTDRFIVRKYAGVQSVDDMVRVNAETEKYIDELVKQHKPIRMLLDLRGSYTISPEIYAEALAVLQRYDIDRIALLRSDDKKVEMLAQNARATFDRTIQYRMFVDQPSAERWLNEA